MASYKRSLHSYFHRITLTENLLLINILDTQPTKKADVEEGEVVSIYY